MSYLSYEDFISQVQNRADLSFESAVGGTKAVLNTLADRISGGEAQDLAAELPSELGAHVRKQAGAPAESFPSADFYGRVGERAGLEPERARVVTEAVFNTLEDALSRKEVSDTKAELPTRLKELLRTPQK